MLILPYVGLSIYPGEVNKLDALVSVIDLPEVSMDICYLMKSEEGNYFFQIGFYLDGSCYTSRERIVEVHNELITYTAKLDWWLIDDLVEHINFYCEEIDYIPAWGKKEYYNYLAKGKTARRLDGPHKGGMLSRTESRMVVYNESKEIVYGPTLSYLAILEKKQNE